MTDSQSLSARGIETVECLVPDFQGLSKGKIVPIAEFEGGQMRLPEAIFGQDVTGEWCEDHDLVDVADVDMHLAPDLSTLTDQPWSDQAMVQCVCDCYTLAGDPVAIAPRTLLRQVIERYHALGLQPIVAQEAEFYLTDPNTDPNEEISPPTGSSGRTHHAPRSFQTEALGEFTGFTRRVRDYAKAQGIALTSLVQEMGPGQLEINFSHGPALQKADEMFLFKRTVRQAAYDEGLYATFLAKPIADATGSAMHLHQSLVDQTTGESAFVDEAGEPNARFFAYLAGLQQYTPMLMAFFAPNPNSYRRFLDADSCPINTAWGYDNRTTGFRVPRSQPAATRVENRIPGSDTNPYLVIAASLAAGWLGITKQLTASEPIVDSAWDLASSLPRSLQESIDSLLGCEAIAELFGARFIGLYADVKQRENLAFQRTVTAWEREHLMLTV